MPNNLDSFFPNRFDSPPQTKIDKILCIVEGGDELSFIKRVYEVYNNSIECQDFVNHKIKLSYGRGIIEWQGNKIEEKDRNKKNCNFQGGDYQEKAPLPILTSLNNEDLELYKAIVVMFDKDRDANDFVEIKSLEIVQEYSDKIIFLSNPCFEKESITFFQNEAVEKFIQENYSIIANSKCRWYKKNYGKCLQFNPIRNKKTLSTIIPLLNKSHFENESINEEMKELINFLRVNF